MGYQEKFTEFRGQKFLISRLKCILLHRFDSMKKITCLLVCIGIYFYSASQITLSRLDFPKPTAATPMPDSVAFTAVNGFSNNASGISGPNQIWNESQLQGSASWSKFVPMSATPLVFQLVFLSCDFAKPLLGGQAFGNGTLTDAYEYYNYSSNNDRLEVKGFGGNLLIPGQTVAIPIPAVYSSPDVLYRFPLMFDNKDSSVSGFDVSVPLGGLGNIQIKRNQQRVNHVDAWGELSIPTGTFEVLRIKSEIQRTDSFITTFGALPFISNPIEIRWLGQEKKIPVLEMTGLNSVNGPTWNQMNYWGWNPLSYSVTPIPALNIFPNPSNGLFELKFEEAIKGPLDVKVIDVTGKQVARFRFQVKGVLREWLPLNHLQRGTYVLQLKYEGRELNKKIQIQ